MINLLVGGVELFKNIMKVAERHIDLNFVGTRVRARDKIYEEPNTETRRRAAILLEIVYSEDVIQLYKRSKIASLSPGEW